MHDHDEELHEHDRGLSHDLPTLLSRRRALGLLGGTGLAVVLAGCGITGKDDGHAGSSAGASTASAGTASDGSSIPEETAGPYPGDGSNGVNVLTESGIVRSDITRSFGSASGVAEGVPLTIRLKVLDTGNGAGALAGAAVYLWHCNIDGRYSLYSEGVTQENYLRGVQETGSDGTVTFTSLPEAACRQVYATDGYSQSLQNLAQTSLETDMVFSDGYSLQLAKVAGNVSDGMTATLNVPV